MKNNALPITDLKKYGIINEDLSFSKILREEDIKKFLQGYTMVADNGKNRATFQLTEDNTRLKVIFLERDRKLSEILESSKEKIQFSDMADLSSYDLKMLSLEKKAFIYDKEQNIVREYDFVKNAEELTDVLSEKKDPELMSIYKNELEKLKAYLQDKLEMYPEFSKEIARDINIVSNVINRVNSISPDEKQLSKDSQSDVDLNVNDRDLYEDAQSERENERELPEETEERQKPRGMRR